MLCNMTILSEIHYSRFVLFVKSGKQWAAPPDGGAARRISAQPEQRLHPQPELDVEVEVPPTLPHEPQPHRRQQLQPGEVPPTLPQPPQPQDEPLPCVQVQVHVQRFEVLELLVPPTEPEFRQQGLQQELATKLGNTIPP